MKHQLCIICFVLIPGWVLAQWPGFNQAIPISIQSPPFDYLQQGGFQNVFQIDVGGTQQDGYLVFGRGILESPSLTSEYTQAFACKVNSAGDPMWWRVFENDTVDLSSQWTNFRRGQGMIQRESGEIVATYTEWNSEISDPWDRSKSFIVILDEHAEILSQTEIMDDTTFTHGYSGLLQGQSDTTYLLYGSWQDSTMYFADEFPDAFLSEVTEGGEVLWERHYPNTFGIWHVVPAMDGGYWVMANEANGFCEFDIVEINDDLVLIKTDSQGFEESRLELGGPCGNESAIVIESEPDQIILASRFTFDDQDNSYDFHGSVITLEIEQVNSNGPLEEVVESRKTYLPCQMIGYVADFFQTDDGYLISGYSNREDIFNNGGQQVGFILKLNNSRDSLWSRFYSHYGGSLDLVWGGARHWLWDSKITSDGGLVCCGELEQSLNDPVPLLRTPWVFKTDSLGCIEPGCQFVHVEEITIGLEQSMSVFPNPANDRATVRFDLPADFSIPDHSQWVMIDLQGREIMRQDLSRSVIQSGDIPLDLSSIAPGIYQIHWIMDSVWLDSVKVVVE
jgi:hypothetical protein